MLQTAADSPSFFLVAPGRRVQISGFEAAPVATDGAGSAAPGASPFSVCGLGIGGALGREIEKGTEKSNW